MYYFILVYTYTRENSKIVDKGRQRVIVRRDVYENANEGAYKSGEVFDYLKSRLQFKGAYTIKQINIIKKGVTLWLKLMKAA